MRATNLYGNPRLAWKGGQGPSDAGFHPQATLAKSFIFFTNVAKYSSA